jgi:hypothetical protein
METTAPRNRSVTTVIVKLVLALAFCAAMVMLARSGAGHLGLISGAATSPGGLPWG